MTYQLILKYMGFEGMQSYNANEWKQAEEAELAKMIAAGEITPPAPAVENEANLDPFSKIGRDADALRASDRYKDKYPGTPSIN